MIKGYKYNNELDAQNAVNSCNSFYNINSNQNNVTKNWVEYLCADSNNPIFWYIIYDKSLNAILGEPEEFSVIK